MSAFERWIFMESNANVNNTILVIDDDRNILAIIELYLKKAGFPVHTCADGNTALAMFHEIRPALVVLDVMLPGKDGWEVLHDIRKESETPVIMLTASDFASPALTERESSDTPSKPGTFSTRSSSLQIQTKCSSASRISVSDTAPLPFTGTPLTDESIT